MKTETHIKKIKIFSILLLFIFAIVTCPVIGASSESSNVQIICKYPGQIIEAGETVNFDLVIKNSGGTSY
ncbi:MAG: alpha-galactosidase, partial [Methanomicrobium sp.]|nr:alpha-galactosidase [Methanomicrobium sp.]